MSYAKIGMKAKPFESRVVEMEYSSIFLALQSVRNSVSDFQPKQPSYRRDAFHLSLRRISLDGTRLISYKLRLVRLVISGVAHLFWGILKEGGGIKSQSKKCLTQTYQIT